MRVQIRGVWPSAFLSAILLFAIAPSVGMARAQNSDPGAATSPYPPNPRSRSIPTMDDQNDLGKDPTSAEQQESRRRAMAEDRQKRIVDETAKLLQLANELKTDVDKSSKDELSLDVVRKADEIERLAHDVKVRMRG